MKVYFVARPWFIYLAHLPYAYHPRPTKPFQNMQKRAPTTPYHTRLHQTSWTIRNMQKRAKSQTTPDQPRRPAMTSPKQIETSPETSSTGPPQTIPNNPRPPENTQKRAQTTPNHPRPLQNPDYPIPPWNAQKRTQATQDHPKTTQTTCGHLPDKSKTCRNECILSQTTPDHPQTTADHPNKNKQKQAQTTPDHPRRANHPIPSHSTPDCAITCRSEATPDHIKACSKRAQATPDRPKTYKNGPRPPQTFPKHSRPPQKRTRTTPDNPQPFQSTPDDPTTC